MTLLSAAELAQMQADIESTALPDTCTVRGTVTRVSNGKGGWTETRGTLVAGAACRLDGLDGSEKMVAGALVPFTKWILTLPHDTQIFADCQVEHNGNTYNVVSGIDADSSWLACVRVVLEAQ